MPDIAMCSGEGCPLKETCYRHTATPTPLRQSWIAPPYADGDCEYYWPTETKPNGEGKP